jgi:hypothetical protein
MRKRRRLPSFVLCIVLPANNLRAHKEAVHGYIEQNLFSWQAVESSTEIQRFHAILDTIEDEELMGVLEAEAPGAA